MLHVLARHLSPIAWAAATTVIVAALLLHLLPHLQILQIAADDFLLAIEAGHRVLDGQMPSRDWPSPIGPLFAFLNAIPVVLGSPADWAHRWADGLLLAVLLPCLLLAGRGLPPGVLPAVAAMATAILFAQYDLLSEDEMVYALAYNRWVNAFLCVPVLWLAAATAGVRPRLASDLSVGVALAVLALTKANAALAGGFIVLAALALPSGRDIRRLLAVAFPPALALGALLISGLLLPYLRDLLEVASASGGRLFFLLRQMLSGLLIAVVVSLAILLVQRRRLPAGPAPWIAAWTIGVLFLGNLQNHTATIPALAVSALSFGAVLWPRDEAGRKTVLPLLIVGGIGTAVLAVEGLRNIRPSVPHDRAEKIDSPLLAHTRILPLEAASGDDRRQQILSWHVSDALTRWRDALTLVAPGETVKTVGQVNVARIAQSHSPRGAFLWQDPARNWKPAHDADPSVRLQGACAVLVRRTPRRDLPEDALLVHHRRTWLSTHATLRAEGTTYDRFDLPHAFCQAHHRSAAAP